MRVQFTGHAGDSWLSYNVWPPYICAMLVGSLQIPMVLVMGDTLGGSSSLSFIVAQLFVRPLENRSPYAKQFRRWTISNYWQVHKCHNFVISVTALVVKCGTSYKVLC